MDERMSSLVEEIKKQIVKMAKESDENPTVDYDDDGEFLNRLGSLRNRLVYVQKTITAKEFDEACLLALAELKQSETE